MQPETRTCQNCKKDFTIEPEDFAFYEKIKVPPPTFCSDCRRQRRFAYRNERALFRRKCDATGKDIFTMFHPDAPYKVYEREYWWSDAWDAIDYGRDYDFSKPFFDQFRALMHDVPWFSRSVNEMVNSDYCMNTGWMKDCYMVFDSSYDENCFYSTNITGSKDSLDLFICEKAELSYELFNSQNCFRTFYSSECRDCHNVWFSKSLVGCSDCIGCVNIKNKKYCIFNEQYSKAEYEQKFKDMRLDTYVGIESAKTTATEFAKQFPVRFMSGTKNINVSGDYIYNSKNIHESYLVSNSEDCKYSEFLQTPPGTRDCYDTSVFGANTELCYESLQGFIDCARLNFTNYMYPVSHDCEYSMACPSSSYLFGCIGLRKKQYCIFNKQYSKEEYEILVPKIKAHMDAMPYLDTRRNVYKYGEFFPMEFSPFAYNETIAQDFFPFTPDEARTCGLTWRDPEFKSYTTTIKATDLFEISETSDAIVNEIVECFHSGKRNDGCTTAFKITPRELTLYRKLNLPLPRFCFSCRAADRRAKRAPMKVFEQSCSCAGIMSKDGIYHNTSTHSHGISQCPNKFKTPYSPGRPEIIYCESCYNQEVA